LEIDATKSGEYQLAHREREVEALKEENDILRAQLGHEIRFLTGEELAERGVSGPDFLAGIHNSEGFGLHPLKYARGLASSLRKIKVPLYVNSPLVSWEQEGDLQVLRTPKGALRAKRVILATNGFTPEHLMIPLRGRLMPALSNILVTRPLSPVELAAQGWHSQCLAYDTRMLLHYFRLLPDGRFLFGGRGGTRADPQTLEPAEKELRQSFERMFPAWRNAETTHFWRGLVCLTYRFVPYAGPLDDEKRIWTSIAYHGSGVALASHSGVRLADWIAGKSGAEEEIPAVMRAGLPRFPFPALRLFYLRSAYKIYRLKDEIL
jgi:glycine/D-amino acid oxidase-like deaminating enzyme